MKALIFGTGSIACRHSRVLHDLGHESIAVSDRVNHDGEIFHEHCFSKLIKKKDWYSEAADIWVIATMTNRHSELVGDLIAAQVDPKRIFCEKPGPSDFFGINVLYNLQHLHALESVGPVVHVAHCANARMWPSDLNWRDRYVFNASLGGGAILTHSHELVHCFPNSEPEDLDFRCVRTIKGKDGKAVNVYCKLRANGIDIELDLIADDPFRYWVHADHVIHFYGKVPEQYSAKTIIPITKVMVEQTYVDMWRRMLQDHDTRLQKDFTWVVNRVS